jgi:hypothetical protein
MPPRPGLPRRLLWFALIWAASVAALGIVGLAIKAALR